MNEQVLKLLYLNRDLGETGLLPDGAIVNIGGVIGDNFTVGGKGIMLADGSTTGPEGTNLVGLQKVYDNSNTGNLILNPDKGISFTGTTGEGVRISGLTGNVVIDSDLQIENVTITGLINNSFSIQKLYDDFTDHVSNDGNVKHTATQISLENSGLTILTATNVQEAVTEIDQYLKRLATIKSHVHQELSGSTLWQITHNKSSLNPSLNIFDDAGVSVFPDEVVIIDENTINVVFYTEQKGKAVIIFA